jgi:transposase
MKRDVRKEKPEVILELRRRAVALKQDGHTHDEIAALLNVSEGASRKWWRLHREGGQAALALGRRGRRTGEIRTLTKEQERSVRRVITDKTPEQIKMPFALWTRPAIAQMIEQRHGVRLPVRTLGEYLKRWGFSPQRPRKTAYERDPVEVRKWLEHDYPRIARRARREKAEVLWGDETGVSNQDHPGRGYAPRGRTPVVRGLARRASTSMISAVGNRGTLRFMVYQGGLKAGTFLMFLKRLVQGSKRKVFLIVDNLRVHKALLVRHWLEANKQRIELFYLPPYSPDLNPDEYLNNTLKSRLRNQPKAGDVAGVQRMVRSQMRQTQSDPALIRRLFQHEAVRYAA